MCQWLFDLDQWAGAERGRRFALARVAVSRSWMAATIDTKEMALVDFGIDIQTRVVSEIDPDLALQRSAHEAQ